MRFLLYCSLPRVSTHPFFCVLLYVLFRSMSPSCRHRLQDGNQQESFTGPLAMLSAFQGRPSREDFYGSNCDNCYSVSYPASTY